MDRYLLQRQHIDKTYNIPEVLKQQLQLSKVQLNPILYLILQNRKEKHNTQWHKVKGKSE
jgi:hypothetical protein